MKMKRFTAIVLFLTLLLCTLSIDAARASSLVINIVAVSDTSLKITWDPVITASGYQVWRRLWPSNTYNLVYDGPASSYTDTGLTSGAWYLYKVRSYIMYLAKPTYQEFSGEKIGVPLDKPATVKAIAASPHSIMVTWSAVANADGYRVYRLQGSPPFFEMAYEGYSSSFSFTDTGLTAGESYTYIVCAWTMIWYTYYLGPSSAAVTCGLQLLAKPELTVMAVNDSSIEISWGAVAGATGYQVYCKTDYSGSYNLIYVGSSTNFTHAGLTIGELHYYIVRAYKDYGTFDYFGPFSDVTIGVPLAVPAAPTAAVSNTTSVKITWTAVSGASGYDIWRSAGATGPYVPVFKGMARAFFDTSLVSGTSYCYKIRAYKLVGTFYCFGPFSACTAIIPQ